MGIFNILKVGELKAANESKQINPSSTKALPNLGKAPVLLVFIICIPFQVLVKVKIHTRQILRLLSA